MAGEKHRCELPDLGVGWVRVQSKVDPRSRRTDAVPLPESGARRVVGELVPIVERGGGCERNAVDDSRQHAHRKDQHCRTTKAPRGAHRGSKRRPARPAGRLPDRQTGEKSSSDSEGSDQRGGDARGDSTNTTKTSHVQASR